jgi:hypothetical protein
LYNVKKRYDESIRIQMFCNFSSMSEWCGHTQDVEYNVLTLQFYLRTLHLTKIILNKRALHELEEGALYVSLSFVNNLLERLNLPFNTDDAKSIMTEIEKEAEDKLYAIQM